jgi:hypothetical protein
VLGWALETERMFGASGDGEEEFITELIIENFWNS